MWCEWLHERHITEKQYRHVHLIRKSDGCAAAALPPRCTAALKQLAFRDQLKAVIRSVGGSSKEFDKFIAEGGEGGAAMRALHAEAEMSGIAGKGGQLPG